MELSLRCSQIVLGPSPRRAEHITLTWGQTNTFKQHLARRDPLNSKFLRTLRLQHLIFARLSVVACTRLRCKVIYRLSRFHGLLGKAECTIPQRAHPVDHTWCHIEVTVGVPSSFYSMPWPAPCFGALPRWSTSKGVLSSPSLKNLQPGCPWAPKLPKPYVHLPMQRLELGSFHYDHAERELTGLQEQTRLALGCSSLRLGTYDAQTSHLPLKRYKMAYLFGEMHNSSPNSVVTLGVLTVVVKAGVARSRWRTGCAQISSLFSWFRACMFVSSVNFRSFRVSATDGNGFCL